MKKDKISRVETARILGVTPQSVSNYIDKGLLSCTRIDKFIYIDRADVLKLQKEGFRTIPRKEHIIEQYTELLDMKIEELERNIYNLNRHINQPFMREIFKDSIELLMIFDDKFCFLTKYQRGRLERYKDFAISAFKEGHLMPHAYVELAKKKMKDFLRILDIDKDIERQLTERNYKLKRENNRLKEKLKELSFKQRMVLVSNKKVIDKRMQILSKRLIDYNLSVRAYNCMRYNNIDTIEDLVSLDKRDVCNLKNLGNKTFKELNDIVSDLGLSFGMDTEKYIYGY